MKIEHEGVLILKDGFFESQWNSETREYDLAPIDPIMIFSKLRMACSIEDNVTLLDLIEHVDKIKHLKLFISQYSWCRAIDEFHAQAREPMRTDENPMEYLQIQWSKSVGDFAPCPNFVGYGKEPPDYEFPDGTGMVRYSVSYTPLYNLADCPLRLDINYKGNKRYFTFLDVLDGVYDDISFMGGPQDNIEFIEDMKARIEDYENGVADFMSLDEWVKDDEDYWGEERIDEL